MKSKANQIYLKQAKRIQDVMSIHYWKFNCRNIICVSTILGGLSVLAPYGRCKHKHKKVDSNNLKVSLWKHLYASIEFIASWIKNLKKFDEIKVTSMFEIDLWILCSFILLH